MDKDEVRAKREALHFMLGAALLEIRASESLNAAKKFADVFHTLPSALLKCSRDEDYDAQFAKIMERAARHGLESYIGKLMEIALRQDK